MCTFFCKVTKKLTAKGGQLIVFSYFCRNKLCSAKWEQAAFATVCIIFEKTKRK